MQRKTYGIWMRLGRLYQIMVLGKREAVFGGKKSRKRGHCDVAFSVSAYSDSASTVERVYPLKYTCQVGGDAYVLRVEFMVYPSEEKWMLDFSLYDCNVHVLKAKPIAISPIDEDPCRQIVVSLIHCNKVDLAMFYVNSISHACPTNKEMERWKSPTSLTERVSRVESSRRLTYWQVDQFFAYHSECVEGAIIARNFFAACKPQAPLQCNGEVIRCVLKHDINERVSLH